MKVSSKFPYLPEGERADLKAKVFIAMIGNDYWCLDDKGEHLSTGEIANNADEATNEFLASLVSDAKIRIEMAAEPPEMGE